MRTCAACGQESPAGFKFCGACGAPLTAPDVREERKLEANRWPRAGLHIIRGELSEAADVLALIGSVVDECLRSAKPGVCRQGESLLAVAS
jgi:hypothetical protein